jgi:Uma2 family endonuclease
VVPRPITIEEYERITDPPGGRYEHRGEVAFVTYPVWEHRELQRRLRKLLEIMAEPLGFIVDTQFPYCPLAENEVWGADVACVSVTRYEATDTWLEGSPELVIEVKSPSNTKAEMHDKAMTTLAGAGAVEFWIVDAETRTVLVHSKAGGMRLYGAGEAVPLPMFGARIVVSQLFAGL